MIRVWLVTAVVTLALCALYWQRKRITVAKAKKFARYVVLPLFVATLVLSLIVLFF